MSDYLVHRLPLRPDFDVEVRLPRDMTKKEAERVTRWIDTFALPDDIPAPPEEPPAP